MNLIALVRGESLRGILAVLPPHAADVETAAAKATSAVAAHDPPAGRCATILA